MKQPSRLVLETQRHLKWRALDFLEAVTMVLCGVCLTGFSASVFFDVLTRAGSKSRFQSRLRNCATSSSTKFFPGF